MKQTVKFEEDEDNYIIKLVDNAQYILEKEIEPQDKPIKIGVSKGPGEGAEMHIREIKFPKTMYHESNVRDTADTIQTRFDKEGCRSCTVLSEINKTRKTFILPTPKDFVDELPDLEFYLE